MASRRRRGGAWALLAATGVGILGPASAASERHDQDVVQLPLPAWTDSLKPTVPPETRKAFSVGERLAYRADVSWGFGLGGGSAVLSVPRMDTVDGYPVYEAEWHIEGSILGFYSINSRFRTWMDERTLASRRFFKDQREGEDDPDPRIREYNIYPEEGRWVRLDYDTTGALPGPLPLDDVSFLYFARSLPLEVGEEYVFDRYFRRDGNPVRLQVLRKDTIQVGAGDFPTIVVRPIIQTNRMFGDGGEAEIHFSDDAHRIVVYMKAKLSVATLKMSLEEIVQLGPEPPP